MNINILVTKYEGKFPDTKIWYVKANTFEEICAALPDAIERKTYTTIKALEKNESFQKDIAYLRDTFSIPKEGFTQEEWDEHKKNRRTDAKYAQWRLNLENALRTLLVSKYKIPTLLHANLLYVVLANMVYLPLNKIYLETPGTVLPLFNGDNLKLVLDGKVSQRELINYIKKNWDDISESMDNVLKSPEEINISDRDFEILELRDNKKLGFDKIADVISDKYNIIISYDAINTAYHRAKKTIESLSS
jgi:hypothetical protein